MGDQHIHGPLIQGQTGGIFLFIRCHCDGHVSSLWQVAGKLMCQRATVLDLIDPSISVFFREWHCFFGGLSVPQGWSKRWDVFLLCPLLGERWMTYEPFVFIKKKQLNDCKFYSGNGKYSVLAWFGKQNCGGSHFF